MNTNKVKSVKVLIDKIDSFLDISYFNTTIEYWDKDKEVFKNKPYFSIGEMFIDLFSKLENLNTDIEITLRMKNFGTSEITVKQIIGKLESKKGKLPLCRELTLNEKDAKKLKEAFTTFSILV